MVSDQWSQQMVVLFNWFCSERDVCYDFVPPSVLPGSDLVWHRYAFDLSAVWDRSRVDLGSFWVGSGLCPRPSTFIHSLCTRTRAAEARFWSFGGIPNKDFEKTIETCNEFELKCNNRSRIYRNRKAANQTDIKYNRNQMKTSPKSFKY